MTRLDSLDLTLALTKKEEAQRLTAAFDRLAELRLALGGKLAGYEEMLGPPVCVVFEGWDASGKGGAIKRLVASGVQLRPYSPEVLDAMLKASNETYAEISRTNAPFKKIYDQMVAFRGDAYLWWQVAEYGFDNFMIRAARAKG